METLGLTQPSFNENGDMIIQIQEETSPIKTGGHYKAKGFAHDFPAGTSSYEFSFPYPIALLAAEFNGAASNAGDTMNFFIGEDTTIGTITSAVSIDDTVINVDNTSVENITVGRWLKLDDGVNTHESCVIAKDIDNNTITLNDPVSTAYSPVSPTFCKMTIRMVEDFEFDSGVRYELGTSKIGGSYIPAGTVFKIYYTNTGSEIVRFKPVLEYLY
jgi:hypothetical protein